MRLFFELIITCGIISFVGWLFSAFYFTNRYYKKKMKNKGNDI